jgi:LAO/AO transport system kinase
MKDKGLRLADLERGGKALLARALSEVEARSEAADSTALLDEAYAAARGQVIGFTGPPGVGKSTLLGALVKAYRLRGESVGIIAVDPSSRRSGGSLLGDRVRIGGAPGDEGMFVRSMAARERLGGLAPMTLPAMIIMRALFDRVIIETVGVGQSETEIETVADTIVFCVQPSSGDSLQFMKAGIVEIPDVAIVTKSDLGASATRAAADLKGALSLVSGPGTTWPVPVLLVSASRGDGIEEVIDVLDRHFAWMTDSSRLAEDRHRKAEAWLRAILLDRFGREGIRYLEPLSLSANESPFAAMARLSNQLRVSRAV